MPKNKADLEQKTVQNFLDAGNHNDIIFKLVFI